MEEGPVLEGLLKMTVFPSGSLNAILRVLTLWATNRIHVIALCVDVQPHPDELSNNKKKKNQKGRERRKQRTQQPRPPLINHSMDFSA